ncbi:Helix-turn-helix domain protein [Pelotomaculum schinkii]|uniref:Helix-turn-helix domain protein n=1 Tax=Pelotomaculum schinkii TaxID=78350 RepID=A0A4Y7RIT8_9FIRM|nr:helix-turn-helix domain-containing protein [Pelotomaculum schinkii]TEB08639.1 Helix-turn-helix domain protein [Pelotomaculum schinkii]
MQELLTPQEAANLLKVHLRTVYIYLRSGELPAAKVGDNWRIRPSDLEKFIEKRMVKDTKK